MKANLAIRSLLVIVIFSLTACLPQAGGGAQDETSAPVATGTVVPPTEPSAATEVPTEVVPAAEPTSSLGELITYRDDYAGYEFDYPTDWAIVDVTQDIRESAQAYAVTISSWEQVGAGTDGIPEGGTKLDIGVWKPETPLASMEEAVAYQKGLWETADPPETILSEEVVTLGDGLQATRFHVESTFGDAMTYVTALNGNMILIGALGDYDLAHEVARTFRPVSDAN